MNLTMLEPGARRWLPLAAISVAVLMAACGGGREKSATQTAVKVNKDEITVHQINHILQQQRGLRPEQTDAASRQILERLIDQQVALRRAEEQKIDRDPRVVQAVEAARREIIARAYLEKVGENAPRPQPDEIKAYYDEKPALFRERRIYSIQEIAIEAPVERQEEIRAALGSAKNINEFLEWLKAKDFRFNGNQAVRAAEQLPLNSLDSFARMQDGQAAFVPTPTGAQVIVLAGSRPQPVTEEQARPAIEQFILNERRRKLVEDHIKELRAASRIEYVGSFAEPAASAPAGTLPAQAPSASAPLSETDISKGLKLK